MKEALIRLRCTSCGFLLDLEPQEVFCSQLDGGLIVIQNICPRCGGIEMEELGPFKV